VQAKGQVSLETSALFFIPAAFLRNRMVGQDSRQETIPEIMHNVGRNPENMSKNDYSELRRTYEDVMIGETASRSRMITERDIIAFAELIDDSNPVHLDAEYAKTTMLESGSPMECTRPHSSRHDRHPPARH
jgi:hypothetical protein